MIDEDTLAHILLAAFLFSCWAGIMWTICRARDVNSTDIPRGVPLVFVPAVWLMLLIIRSWHRQRVATFLKLANDLRVREKGVDRRIPFGSRR